MDFALGPLTHDFDLAVALLNEALGARSYSRSRLERELHDPRAHFLSARDDAGALIGAASAKLLDERDLPFYDQFGEAARVLAGRRVGSLYVSAVVPAWRGRGLGSALARARLAWLDAQGTELVVGISWASGLSHTSRPVFERHGFRHVATSDELFTRLSTEHDFDCPTCGHPCRCPALLYVRG